MADKNKVNADEDGDVNDYLLEIAKKDIVRGGLGIVDGVGEEQQAEAAALRAKALATVSEGGLRGILAKQQMAMATERKRKRDLQQEEERLREQLLNRGDMRGLGGSRAGGDERPRADSHGERLPRAREGTDPDLISKMTEALESVVTGEKVDTKGARLETIVEAKDWNKCQYLRQLANECSTREEMERLLMSQNFLSYFKMEDKPKYAIRTWMENMVLQAMLRRALVEVDLVKQSTKGDAPEELLEALLVIEEHMGTNSMLSMGFAEGVIKQVAEAVSVYGALQQIGLQDGWGVVDSLREAYEKGNTITIKAQKQITQLVKENAKEKNKDKPGPKRMPNKGGRGGGGGGRGQRPQQQQQHWPQQQQQYQQQQQQQQQPWQGYRVAVPANGRGCYQCGGAHFAKDCQSQPGAGRGMQGSSPPQGAPGRGGGRGFGP
jgi:hypothetical protein